MAAAERMWPNTASFPHDPHPCPLYVPLLLTRSLTRSLALSHTHTLSVYLNISMTFASPHPCPRGGARPKPPKPQVCNPQPSTLNPQPLTRNPHPASRNPKPETRNTKHETRNPQLETLSTEGSNSQSEAGGVGEKRKMESWEVTVCCKGTPSTQASNPKP